MNGRSAGGAVRSNRKTSFDSTCGLFGGPNADVTLSAIGPRRVCRTVSPRKWGRLNAPLRLPQKRNTAGCLSPKRIAPYPPIDNPAIARRAVSMGGYGAILFGLKH